MTKHNPSQALKKNHLLSYDNFMDNFRIKYLINLFMVIIWKSFFFSCVLK